jgi:hypothetical protein
MGTKYGKKVEKYVEKTWFLFILLFIVIRR